MNKVIVFSKGKYPIGSWSQRIRMMHYGFKENNVYMEYIVPFPAPTYDRTKNSEYFVKFMLSPVDTEFRNITSIFYKIYGTIRGISVILKEKKLEFILLPGLDFLQGALILLICKIKKIKVYAEIADENGKLFSEEKLTFIEVLAKYNQLLYEKFILKYVDVLFVFTSYLEKKYSNKYPKLLIRKTVPTLVDMNTYSKLKRNNIFDINHKNIAIYNKKSIKITYAGACNRTNGLQFFLECFSNVEKNLDVNVDIIFICGYGNLKRFQEIYEQYNISQPITILETILPQYIPSIYEKSDILLLPEQGTIIATAGFPGKVSEYLASGKAILSTDFSDLSLYLTHEYNAMLAPLGDVKNYSKNLRRLLTEPHLRKKLGANAITTAKNNFTAKEAVKRYINKNFV